MLKIILKFGLVAIIFLTKNCNSDFYIKEKVKETWNVVLYYLITNYA